MDGGSLLPLREGAMYDCIDIQLYFAVAHVASSLVEVEVDKTIA